MEKILFVHLPKILVTQNLAFFFQIVCLVTMSDYCLDGLQTTTKPQNNNNWIKDKQSNGKENKRKK